MVNTCSVLVKDLQLRSEGWRVFAHMSYCWDDQVREGRPGLFSPAVMTIVT